MTERDRRAWWSFVAPVGAGPLEDLLNQHGVELVDDLERSWRHA